MIEELKNAISTRCEQLGITADPKFPNELAVLITVFYEKVKAVGAKNGVTLNVEAKIQIESKPIRKSRSKNVGLRALNSAGVGKTKKG